MEALDAPRRTWLRPAASLLALGGVVYACVYMAQVKAERTHFTPPNLPVEVLRTAVETATDLDVQDVRRTPGRISLAQLKSVPRDARLMLHPGDFANKRIRPFETRTWRLTATVLRVSIRADNDLYLVIEDAGQRNAVEIPDPKRCVGSPFYGQIAGLRKQLEHDLHPGAAGVVVDRRAELTGIGFYGTAGTMQNGARLLPLLALKWLSPPNPHPRGRLELGTIHRL